MAGNDRETGRQQLISSSDRASAGGLQTATTKRCLALNHRLVRDLDARIDALRQITRL